MRRLPLVAVLFAILSVAVHLARPPRRAGERVVAPGAALTVLAQGFAFTEGPAEDASGRLYWTDIPASRIHRRASDGTVSVFRERSGGANGLAFDAEGRLIACEGDRGRVTATDPAGRESVLLEGFGGRKFNKPNDLWIDARGGIYVSDPAYGVAPTQDGEHVYHRSPSGEVRRVTSDLSRPNGLCGSPDGRVLYVADERGGTVFAFDIAPDGTLHGKRPFAAVRGDGVKVDAAGNVLVAAPEGIRVFDPSGREVDTIPIPGRPTNLCLAGADRKTLVVTSGSAVYAIRLR